MDEAVLARLNPTYRADFEASVVRTWRITWPDGETETVRSHALEVHSEQGLAVFRWNYVSVYRIVNLAHVREVEEVFE